MEIVGLLSPQVRISTTCPFEMHPVNAVAELRCHHRRFVDPVSTTSRPTSFFFLPWYLTASQ